MAKTMSKNNYIKVFLVLIVLFVVTVIGYAIYNQIKSKPKSEACSWTVFPDNYKDAESYYYVVFKGQSDPKNIYSSKYALHVTTFRAKPSRSRPVKVEGVKVSVYQGSKHIKNKPKQGWSTGWWGELANGIDLDSVKATESVSIKLLLSSGKDKILVDKLPVTSLNYTHCL